MPAALTLILGHLSLAYSEGDSGDMRKAPLDVPSELCNSRNDANPGLFGWLAFGEWVI